MREGWQARAVRDQKRQSKLMARARWIAAASLLWVGVMSAAAAESGAPALARTLKEIAKPGQAPALKLKDMDGKTHDLADLKGKVVLINFWATWCPPCRREMPSLERLAQQLKGQPFQVLAVDVGEDAETIFGFLGSLQPPPSFPIVLDADSKVVQSWPVRGLPTTFVVDKQGRLAFNAIGGREFDDPAILKQLRELIAQP